MTSSNPAENSAVDGTGRDPSPHPETPAEPNTPPDTTLVELKRDEAKIPPAPWELWTSCSYRRITGPDGKEGGVLHAYNQRSDGHPDLSMPEDQLLALVRLRNALPALLSRIEQLEAENAAAKQLSSLTSSADEVALLTRYRKAQDAWDWLAEHINLELNWGDHPDAAEGDPCVWLVHSVNGGRSDREWDLIGFGDTPLEAVEIARQALSPPPSTTQGSEG